MSRNDLDRALHDYLDGRMSERERAAFEEQLARNEELAKRVAFHRSIGEALRTPVDGLRPGFGARARARFESREPRRPGFRRILRWEAAGLAAGAVLLAFLLIPSPWQPETPPLERPAPASEGTLDDTPADRPPVPEPPPAISKEVPSKKKSRDARAENELHQTAKPSAEEDAAGAADQESVADARERKDEASEGLAGVAAPAPESAAAPPSPSQPARLNANVGLAAKSDSGMPPELRAWPLPEGIATGGSLRVIDATRAEASNDIDELAREALAELQPVPGRERVVLIGPREKPVACGGYSIEVLPAAVRIILSTPEPGGPADRGGCAVVIPALPLGVVVEDSPGE